MSNIVWDELKAFANEGEQFFENVEEHVVILLARKLDADRRAAMVAAIEEVAADPAPASDPAPAGDTGQQAPADTTTTTDTTTDTTTEEQQ